MDRKTIAEKVLRLNKEEGLNVGEISFRISSEAKHSVSESRIISILLKDANISGFDDDRVIRKIIKQYAQGIAISQIVEATDKSSGFIEKVAKALNAPRGKVVVPKKKTRIRYTAQQLRDLIEQMNSDGMADFDIAEKLNVTRQHIARVRKKMGLSSPKEKV